MDVHIFKRIQNNLRTLDNQCLKAIFKSVTWLIHKIQKFAHFCPIQGRFLNRAKVYKFLDFMLHLKKWHIPSQDFAM